MIYSLLVLIVFSCFSSTHISLAMENEKKIVSQEIIASQQISAIKDPQFARYITNNLVVIGGKGCALFDLTTNESKKISTHYCSCLDVHSDKKKIAFSHDNSIEIYNVETDKCESSKEEKHFIDSFAFNTLQDNLVVSLTKDTHLKNLIVTKRDYTQDKSDEDLVENKCYSRSAFCQKQQLVCIAEAMGDVLLYPLADLTSKPNIITLEHEVCDCIAGPNHFVAVICTEGRTISVIKLQDNDGAVYCSIKPQDNQLFTRACFYPIGDILVTTSMFADIYNESKSTYCMHYWDIKTQEIIHEMELKEFDTDFSFVHDGKNVIVAFQNMCQIFPVPFLKIIYKDEIEKRFPLLLLLLREQINNCEQDFPQDISLLLKYILLKAFRR